MAGSLRPKDKVLVSPDRRLILEWDAFFERLEGRIAGIENAAAFRAVSGGTQTIPSGGSTKLNFATEVFDANSDFANSRFTVAVPGKYLFIAQAAIDFTGIGPLDAWIQLYKNGGSQTTSGNRLFSATAGAALYPHVSTIESAVAGDYFEVYLYQNSSGNQDVLFGRTYFCGTRVAT